MERGPGGQGGRGGRERERGKGKEKEERVTERNGGKEREQVSVGGREKVQSLIFLLWLYYISVGMPGHANLKFSLHHPESPEQHCQVRE